MRQYVSKYENVYTYIMVSVKMPKADVSRCIRAYSNICYTMAACTIKVFQEKHEWKQCPNNRTDNCNLQYNVKVYSVYKKLMWNLWHFLHHRTIYLKETTCFWIVHSTFFKILFSTSFVPNSNVLKPLPIGRGM